MKMLDVLVLGEECELETVLEAIENIERHCCSYSHILKLSMKSKKCVQTLVDFGSGAYTLKCRSQKQSS